MQLEETRKRSSAIVQKFLSRIISVATELTSSRLWCTENVYIDN